jgi:hypothetical protein
VPLSVQRTLACPLPSVVEEDALNDPFPDSTLHVTVAPLTAAPALVTVTTNGAPSTEDSVPLCASPLDFAMRRGCGGLAGGAGGGGGATGGAAGTSPPGVVGVDAAHAIVAENSNSARAIRKMRIVGPV